MVTHCFYWWNHAARLVTPEMNPVFIQTWKKMMLTKLFDIIEDCRENPVEGSYTNSLMSKGQDKISQKVGEEAVEEIVAAGSQGKQRVIEESADLIYHLLVLLVQQEITLNEIEVELEKRHRG